MSKNLLRILMNKPLVSAWWQIKSYEERKGTRESRVHGSKYMLARTPFSKFTQYEFAFKNKEE
ncbi:MAG: hypothetical protein DA405_08615 [Bacteroidetes bacterium]|nr:MAG: hypothetical protein DA405_08615 [Bacteroidota bacterium]